MKDFLGFWRRFESEFSFGLNCEGFLGGVLGGNAVILLPILGLGSGLGFADLVGWILGDSGGIVLGVVRPLARMVGVRFLSFWVGG